MSEDVTIIGQPFSDPEDEADELLAKIYQSDEDAVAQALAWCITSRREWRKRALLAEERAERLTKILDRGGSE
jgi:hypothetical protein